MLRFPALAMLVLVALSSCSNHADKNSSSAPVDQKAPLLDQKIWREENAAKGDLYLVYESEKFFIGREGEDEIFCPQGQKIKELKGATEMILENESGCPIAVLKFSEVEEYSFRLVILADRLVTPESRKFIALGSTQLKATYKAHKDRTIKLPKYFAAIFDRMNFGSVDPTPTPTPTVTPATPPSAKPPVPDQHVPPPSPDIVSPTPEEVEPPVPHKPEPPRPEPEPIINPTPDVAKLDLNRPLKLELKESFKKFHIKVVTSKELRVSSNYIKTKKAGMITFIGAHVLVGGTPTEDPSQETAPTCFVNMEKTNLISYAPDADYWTIFGPLESYFVRSVLVSNDGDLMRSTISLSRSLNDSGEGRLIFECSSRSSTDPSGLTSREILDVLSNYLDIKKKPI